MMANIANIVAFDGASTPVSHTLVPEGISRKGDVLTAAWREKIATLPDEAQVRLTFELTKLKSNVVRVEKRTVVPVMESISGQNASGYTAAPKVAYEDTDVHIFYAHPRSTVASRRLCRQLAQNIDGNVTTSVAPATTGPLPELIDMLLMPT